MLLSKGIAKLGIFSLLVVGQASVIMVQQPKLNLMPMPASVQQGSGNLKMDSTFW